MGFALSSPPVDPNCKFIIPLDPVSCVLIRTYLGRESDLQGGPVQEGKKMGILSTAF